MFFRKATWSARRPGALQPKHIVRSCVRGPSLGGRGFGGQSAEIAGGCGGRPDGHGQSSPRPAASVSRRKRPLPRAGPASGGGLDDGGDTRQPRVVREVPSGRRGGGGGVISSRAGTWPSGASLPAVPLPDRFGGTLRANLPTGSHAPLRPRAPGAPPPRRRPGFAR